MLRDRLDMLRPKGFWEWLLVLFVVGSGLLFAGVPLALMTFLLIHGY